MNNTLLITGGCGFIGSHFVQRIFNRYPNYKIIVLDALTYASGLDNIPQEIKDSQRFSFHYGNICNSDLVNKLVSQSDMVINFSAETHVSRSIFDNLLFFQTDTLGTQSIANAVLNNLHRIERFIHISTSEVYGTAEYAPMDEKHPLNPTTPYASAKLGGDRLVYSYWRTYNIPATIIRPFNQFGEKQHLEKVIPRFITSALLNEPLTIHGTGEYTRDWNYVEDLCEALDRALHVDLNKVKGQVINIGTGKDTSIKTIAEMVLDKLPTSKSKITYMSDRLGQVDRHISSTDKAFNLLKWKPLTDFNTGLDKTIKWYYDNPEWWKKLRWLRQVETINVKGEKELY